MALNHWVGMGRLTATPELKTTPNGVSVATFSIAVDRDYKGQNGEKQTDFISVVSWRQTAEFVSRYFQRGNMICVEGGLQTRSYTDKDGKKRTITEVIADKVHFTGEKKDTATPLTTAYTAQQTTPQETPQETVKFEELTDDVELPF